MLGHAAILTAMSAAAPASFGPPTLEDVKREVSAVREKYRAFSVEWTWEVAFRTDGGPLTCSERTMYRLDVAAGGRVRDGWRLPATATGVEAALSHDLRVFDGVRSVVVQPPEFGSAKKAGMALVVIEPGEDRVALGAVWPFDYERVLWHEWDAQPLDVEIGDIEWTASAPTQEDLGGAPTVVVELTKELPSGIRARRRMWLDPARSWTALRTDVLQSDAGGPWKVLEGRLMSDLRLVDGVWTPYRIELRDPEAAEPGLVRSLTVTKFSFGEQSVRKGLIAKPWSGRASVNDGTRRMSYSTDDEGHELMPVLNRPEDSSTPKVLRDQNRDADEYRESVRKLDAERAARHSGVRSGWRWGVVGVLIGVLTMLSVVVWLRRR